MGTALEPSAALDSRREIRAMRLSRGGDPGVLSYGV